jgi:CoA-transferase family III
VTALACTLAGDGVGTDYARQLLGGLGIDVAMTPAPPDPHPAVAWAQSGAMALTGAATGPAEICPAPLASCADGALAALAALARTPLRFAGSRLLGERAAIAGLSRAGSIAPGGACRLLPSGDGWLAVNLARADDWDLLPAWLEQAVAPDWAAVAAALEARSTAALIERGRELGLALAAVMPPAAMPVPWRRVLAEGPARVGPPPSPPLVVDLTALWAGPLAGHLLQQLGARVIKIESRSRPDGARSGPVGFYDLLNGGKPSVALDFATPAGRAQLRALIDAADIVLESARPRALQQLGIDAADHVRSQPGLSWISLTGYGRTPPQAGWIAFGDDAGVAAGLSALLPCAGGRPIFCGDAIADPLTGIHAALAAWSSHLGGRSQLVSLALHDIVAQCIQFGAVSDAAARREEWAEVLAQSGLGAAAPLARHRSGPARALGADTAAILAELAPRC